ncbi:MAG: glutamine-hydrolyzing carbamoyl-phosphate synthase small subunit [Spirochaetaceae bacterium]|nr:glutamine-hydrolyzing carbamoyl-phosphate synthase small subunit [Spirochaetaceae bacterium]
MKAWLILADGTIFEGTSIGKTGRTIGETVFTTGMTGYLETLTDPSYFGQIVTQTFPLIGNYGVIPQDFESRKCYVRGYIVRELCDEPSNFRCGGILNDFLKAQGIIGICGIDTRALTKKLRESGVMNGMIISGEEAEKSWIQKPSTVAGVQQMRSVRDDSECHAELVSASILDEIKAYKIVQAVESVQDNQIENHNAETKILNDEVHHHIVLWDFGAKANIKRELEKRGCKVTVASCSTSAEQILALKPDGLMLSNGPGDPADNTGVIEEIRKLCEWNKETLKLVQGDSASHAELVSAYHAIPIFGICLGHQMLALARGAKTSKLKYGHRGGNHPVKDTATNRVYITSQNHGYAVEADTLPSFATMSFFNVNDNTCEGVRYNDIPAFSVQFHPEACGGPHDTNFLFDEFMKMMEEHHAS